MSDNKQGAFMKLENSLQPTQQRDRNNSRQDQGQGVSQLLDKTKRSVTVCDRLKFTTHNTLQMPPVVTQK